MTVVTFPAGWIDEHTYRICEADKYLDYCTTERGAELFGLSPDMLKLWYEDSVGDHPKKNRWLGRLLRVMKGRRERRGRGVRLFLIADLREIAEKYTAAAVRGYKPPTVVDEDGTPLLTDKDISERYEVSSKFLYWWRAKKTRVRDRGGKTRCEPADRALRGILLPRLRRGKGGPIHIWHSRQDDVERILRGEETEPSSGGGNPTKAARRKKTKDQAARQWLENLLRRCGPLPADIVIQLASETNMSRSRIYRAKRALGVEAAVPPGERGRPVGIPRRSRYFCSRYFYWRLAGQELPAARPSLEEVRAKLSTSNGESLQSMPLGDMPPRRRSGPHYDPDTAALYQFCYEQLAAHTLKRSQICELATKLYPAYELVESDVTNYARRHAQRTGKPWPV
jgi:hypothetical protein